MKIFDYVLTLWFAFTAFLCWKNGNISAMAQCLVTAGVLITYADAREQAREQGRSERKCFGCMRTGEGAGISYCVDCVKLAEQLAEMEPQT